MVFVGAIGPVVGLFKGAENVASGCIVVAVEVGAVGAADASALVGECVSSSARRESSSSAPEEAVDGSED